MKRSFFSKKIRQPLLAVPTAALMLGAAHAGTTVGINYTMDWTPYNYSSYTSGFNVTSKAFGVEVPNWVSVQGSYGSTVANTTVFNGVTVISTGANTWTTGIGNTDPDPTGPGTVNPGDDEVTWGMLDNTGWSVDLQGLNAAFPNGYVVGIIGAGKTTGTSAVFINNDADSSTLATVHFTLLANACGFGASPLLSADAVTLVNPSRPNGTNVAMGGFIVTDVPVVSTKPVGGVYNLGNPFTVSAGAIGIPPLTYQWLKNGAPIANATNLTYNVASAGAGDAANYQLVAANAYGSGTSVVAAVSVLLSPTFLSNLSPVTNYLTMNAKFAPTVGGQAPLSYKWLKNGAPITSATNTSLTLTNLQASDDALYQLVITNILGAATSSVAHVSVLGSLPPYEGFAYDTNSTLLSATTAGGIGWSGGWVQTPGYNGENIVTGPSAGYHDTVNQLVTAGGTVQLAGSGTADFEDIRALQCNLNNGTVYLSFIGQITNTGWGGVELTQTAGTNDQTEIFLGAQWYGQNWGWGGRGGGGPASSVPSSTLSLLVYRFDFTPTNTLVRLYINPTFTNEPASPALSGTWAMTSFNKVRIVAHGSSTPDGIIDELRIGGTWAAVTPNTLRTDPPTIVKDLSATAGYAYAGNPAGLTVVANGAPTLHYLWVKDGTRIGPDSATLSSLLSAAGSGNYSVTVTNLYGSAQSTTQALTVVTDTNLYTETVGQDIPGAWWPLSEASGSVAYDYSGSGNNGNLNGNPTQGANGPRTPAYQGFSSTKLAYLFDGASSYLDCGTGPSLAGTTDFTVEAWVNTTNSATGVVVQQRSTGGYNGEYQLEVKDNGTVYFMVFGGGASQFGLTSPANGKYVNDGKWHHIAATRSGAVGTIYIDGAAVAWATNATVAPLDATIGTYIGVDQRGLGNFFSGLIADVAIYSHAVSPANLASHAAKGVLGTSPLVLTTGTGGFIEDSKPAGTPHPGLNYGTAWLASSTDSAGTPVTRNGVAHFPLGRQLVIPASADFNSPTGTICFWMRAGVPASGTGTMLFDRRTSAGTILFLDGTSLGAISIQTAGGVNSFTGGYVTDDNWHHVALTYDQSNGGILTLYVDGTVANSQANSAAWSWPTNQQIELGRSHDTYWQRYAGEMDDVRIYSRILTAGEVATIAAPATSDTLIDTGTLVGRYNFTTAGVGQSLNWPVGKLLSSPGVAPGDWQPVSNVNTVAPFISPTGATVTTNATLYYRVGF